MKVFLRAEEEEHLRRVEEVLRTEIEMLVDETPLISQAARTPRGTHHVVLANGYIKPEGEPTARWGWSPLRMAARTLKLCRHMRSDIEGPAVLYWRHFPSFEHETADDLEDMLRRATVTDEPDGLTKVQMPEMRLKLYVRLSFEAL